MTSDTVAVNDAIAVDVANDVTDALSEDADVNDAVTDAIAVNEFNALAVGVDVGTMIHTSDAPVRPFEVATELHAQIESVDGDAAMLT